MILIVDDSADTAEALRRLFCVAGYSAITAPNGRQALAAIRALPPTVPLLVVLDDMMPVMGGVEALRAIRADPAIAGTQVIFYTASIDAERRNEALASGALGWLPNGGFGAPGVEDIVCTITGLYDKISRTNSLAKREHSSRPPSHETGAV